MVSKKAKAGASGTAPTTAPKTRRAPRRATALKRRDSLADDSPPLAAKRAKRASTRKLKLNLESHQAAPEGPDAEGAMAIDHEGAALQGGQSPRHKANITGDLEVNSADLVSNPEDTTEIDLVNNHKDSAEIDIASNSKDAAKVGLVGNHEDGSEIDMVSNREDAALQGGQSPCYEEGMAKESVPADYQEQPEKSLFVEHFPSGCLSIKWPFPRPEKGDSSHFTTAEYDRLEEATDHTEGSSQGEVLNLLKALGNNLDKYVNSSYPHHPQIVVQSLTWNILINDLFSPDCTEKWCGEAWMSFATMLAHFRGRLKDPSSDYASWYHCWRSESARMAYALNGKSSNPERIKKILTEQLGQIATMSAEAGELLDCMARTATDMELMIQTSPLCFKLGMHHPSTLERSGFPYFKHWQIMMPLFDETNRSQGAPVDIIASPWLRVYGKSTSSSARPAISMYHKFDLYYHSRPMMVHTEENFKSGDGGSDG
ncbi:hypothetical protein G7Z17_g4308 [Cylindrodendrum hubeiense]|uniref:Uncharacterized protein n=1 Tax=Cylindrodendrum hubeiense TaxID=595255 RepID=A0A9P5HE34_9HYPO|nr:hypothetical protein G7Z17_g4308 [Cylindrodendrum hubeiense]